MRKWMIGMTMALMVSVFAGQALAEDIVGQDTAAVEVVPEQASVQGKAHAHHGKKKGHDKHHGHEIKHKKS